MYTYMECNTCIHEPVVVLSMSIMCVSLIVHVDAFTFTHVYIHRIYYSDMCAYIECIYT